MKEVIDIRFEHIRMVQHDIGNGITEPKLAMTDDNTLVVVKTFNCPEGSLVLFNEYICYRLASILDIPMPKSGVCLIDGNTILCTDCVKDDQYGYGFYSTYLKKHTTLVETIIPMLSNKEDFLKILLFDHIVFNTDRNSGNLLVQYYKNNIFLRAIDHTHVFVNQAIWDANCLNRAMREKDYYSTRVLEENSYLYGMFFRNMSVCVESFNELNSTFKSKITESLLNDLVSDIPAEWMPSNQNIEALFVYILYRVKHIDDICITISNFVKN